MGAIEGNVFDRGVDAFERYLLQNNFPLTPTVSRRRGSFDIVSKWRRHVFREVGKRILSRWLVLLSGLVFLPAFRGEVEVGLRRWPLLVNKIQLSEGPRCKALY